MLIDILVYSSFAIGLTFCVIGTIGLLKLPDVYSRAHATGLIDTMGIFGISVGLILKAGFSLISMKVFLLTCLIIGMSAPITHVFLRVALGSKIKPYLAKDGFPDSSNSNSSNSNSSNSNSSNSKTVSLSSSQHMSSIRMNFIITSSTVQSSVPEISTRQNIIRESSKIKIARTKSPIIEPSETKTFKTKTTNNQQVETNQIAIKPSATKHLKIKIQNITEEMTKIGAIN